MNWQRYNNLTVEQQNRMNEIASRHIALATEFVEQGTQERKSVIWDEIEELRKERMELMREGGKEYE